MLVLAIDNMVKAYRASDNEHLPGTQESVLAFVSFFLLGVSSIYIARNIALVFGYLPHKGWLANIRQVNDVHLSRYSDAQLSGTEAVFVLSLSMVLFGLNYMFQWVSVNFMIWAAVTGISWLLYLLGRNAHSR
jgi:hypothetical protein